MPSPPLPYKKRDQNLWLTENRIKVVPNCLNCQQNWLETFCEFLAPYLQKKNQSCPKLPKVARKLFENDFRNCCPHHLFSYYYLVNNE